MLSPTRASLARNPVGTRSSIQNDVGLTAILYDFPAERGHGIQLFVSQDLTERERRRCTFALPRCLKPSPSRCSKATSQPISDERLGNMWRFVVAYSSYLLPLGCGFFFQISRRRNFATQRMQNPDPGHDEQKWPFQCIQNKDEFPSWGNKNIP